MELHIVLGEGNLGAGRQVSGRKIWHVLLDVLAPVNQLMQGVALEPVLSQVLADTVIQPIR